MWLSSTIRPMILKRLVLGSPFVHSSSSLHCLNLALCANWHPGQNLWMRNPSKHFQKAEGSDIVPFRGAYSDVPILMYLPFPFVYLGHHGPRFLPPLSLSFCTISWPSPKHSPNISNMPPFPISSNYRIEPCFHFSLEIVLLHAAFQGLTKGLLAQENAK